MNYSAKQRRVKVSVQGVDRIRKMLKSMEDAASDVLLKGAKAGGKIALSYAKEHCPVDTGRLRNSLKLTDDKKTPKKATVKVDYDKSLRYGTFVELGARGKKANPFMRNAVDKNQRAINKTIVSTISKALGGKL